MYQRPYIPRAQRERIYHLSNALSLSSRAGIVFAQQFELVSAKSTNSVTNKTYIFDIQWIVALNAYEIGTAIDDIEWHMMLIELIYGRQN